MNKMPITALMVLFFASQSCTDNKPGNISHKQPSLAGKIYGLSDPINTSCERIPVGTDYYPELLFMDDSTFIKIVNTCCAGLGDDFASSWYYTGKYEMDDEKLVMNFDKYMTVYYIKETENSDGNTLISSTHTERERSDIIADTLKRLDCEKQPYFKQLNGSWKDVLLVQGNDTLENYIKEMKAEKVWYQLFNDKN